MEGRSTGRLEGQGMRILGNVIWGMEMMMDDRPTDRNGMMTVCNLEPPSPFGPVGDLIWAERRSGGKSNERSAKRREILNQIGRERRPQPSGG